MGNIDADIRPRTISELYKSQAERTITNIVQSGFIHHSFLLSGHFGSGKTTTARALASYLFTKSTDAQIDLDDNECYIEVNAGKYSGVNEMRALLGMEDQAGIMNSPLLQDVIVLVLDEAHRLTVQAQSVLLKPVEEPPDHLYIILCTNEPDKIKKELRDRCQTINFQKPNQTMLIDYANNYAIDKIKSKFGTGISQYTNNVTKLRDNTTLQAISAVSDSYRAMAINIYNYIITGVVADGVSGIDTTRLVDIHSTLIKPDKSTWRSIVQSTVETSTSHEDTRTTICNYLSAVLCKRLTTMTSDSTIAYMRAISILKEPLSPTNQKADLLERLSRIVLTNCGVLQ